MQHQILISLALTFIMISCNNHNKESTPQLISDSEYIQLAESLSFPSIDSILIKDSDGNIVSKEYLSRLDSIENYFTDFYKNSNNKIVEGIIRKQTKKDELLLSKIFKIELEQHERNEISELESIESKEIYLINLWNEDQKIRNGEQAEIATKYGWNSREHKRSRADFIRKDKKVFQKLKLFLERYGYPEETSKFHWKAKDSFQTIIGHKRNYNDQREMLNYLFAAHKKGYCNKEGIVWILGEMYETSHRGQRYIMKSDVITTDQEYKELMHALNLKLE